MSIRSNLFWAGGSQAIRVAVQLAFIVSMARYLQPEDFGVMAVASAVVAFAVMIRDLGTSAAIIQQTDLQESTISGAFWLNLAMGLLCALLLVGLSPLAARLFNAKTLIPILCLLACTFLVSSSTVVHQAILERTSQFRRLALIEMGSNVTGLTLGLFAASRGAGVYSFVVQALSQSLLSSSLLWKMVVGMPSVRPDSESIRRIFHFSSNLTLFNILNYVSRNADSMIVGSRLGTHPLGIYSIAYQIMLFPAQNLTGVTNRALYPILCRRQESLQENADLILRTVRNIALVTAPMMAILWVLRKPFIQFVFGNRWAEAENLITWLAPVGFMQSLYGVTGIVFMAKGKTDRLLFLGCLSAILNLGAFWVGSIFGITGVAICYFAINILVGIMCAVAISMELRISILRQASTIFPAILGSLITAGVLIPFSKLLVERSLFVHLGLSGLAGILVYSLLIIQFYPSIWKTMLQEMGMAAVSGSGDSHS